VESGCDVGGRTAILDVIHIGEIELNKRSLWTFWEVVLECRERERKSGDGQ
jgi:hypothetical protein